MNDATVITCSACGATLDASRGQGRCAACMFGEAMPPGGDESFGGHELIEEIARGGMGVVYRARQREPEREVAIKTLRGAALDSPAALARFQHEARAMADLDHPAILPVFNFGEQDGVPFFTMKLARGGTLAARLDAYAGKWRAVAELVAAIADAVHYAHERGVLHRDLKPANILFDEDGRAFVSDFGIAKLTDDSATVLTLTAAVLGTPHYVAPEIAAGDARAATTASDVWSLGVILYELLAQCRPFEGDTVAAVLRTIEEREPAALNAGTSNAERIPRDLCVITLTALAKARSRRYGSAREFAQDLRRWLRGQPIVARSVGRMERLLLWARRKPALAALSLLSAVAWVSVAVALVWGFQSSRREVANVRAANVSAQKELRQALFDRAHSGRNARLAGWRESGLAALQEAAAIRAGDDLRDEAIAHLVGFDMVKADGPVIPVPRNPINSHVVLPRAFDVFATLLDATGDARGWREGRDKFDGSWLNIPVHAVLHRMSDGQRLASSPVLPGAHKRALRCDPAGRWLVVVESGGRNSGILLLDAKTLESRAHFPGCDYAGFNDDGSRLALIERGKRVRIIKPDDMSDVGIMPKGRSMPTRAVLWTDPGETLVVVAGPHANRHSIEYWDWSRGKMLLLIYSDDEVYSLACQGDWLAAGTQQGNVRLVNHRQRRSVYLTAHADVVWHEAFSPDGLLLATCSYDGSSALWQTDSGQLLVRSTTQSPTSIAADGRRFIEGRDLAASWGEITHSRALRIISDRVIGWGETRLNFSPDGRWLCATWLKTTAIFDTITGRLLTTFPRRDARISFFTADGRHLILSGSDEIILAALDVHDGRLRIQQVRDLTPVPRPGGWAAGLSENRRWLGVMQPGGRAAVLDCRDFGAWVPFSGPSNAANVTPGNDGRWIVADAFNNHDGLRLWSRDHPTEPRLLNSGNAYALISPDGRWLAEINAHQGLLFYDTNSWQVARREDGQKPIDRPTHLAWSPDSRLLAYCGRQRIIRLLDTETWKIVAELTSPLDRAIGQIKFSPDGRTLAASRQSGGIELWDLTKLSAELAALGLAWELPPPVPVAETPPEFAVPLEEAELPPLFPAEAKK